MASEVQKLYGNRVRVRACGLLVQHNSLLMVNHQSVTQGDFWAPPGGGVDFEETAEACLQREFEEETGLEIEVSDFLFAGEFIHAPLHAIELFFKVNLIQGVLRTGRDPEMKPDRQIIKNVKFLTWSEIQKMKPATLHGIFKLVPDPSAITELKGYLKLR